MVSQILTRDDLRASVPSVFATQPYSRMSDRYRMVGTDGVLDIMGSLGFHPVKASQSRSRTEGKQAFTRHMLRLRHIDHIAPAVGDELPEIVLENSHDGTAAYRLHAGIFRLVCSNGLVVASADFGTISVKHSGGRDFERRIIDATHQIAERTPQAFATVAEWKGINLTRPQQLAFAEQAMTIKPNDAIRPAFLLTARRQDDAVNPDFSRDLWRTTNVIQESLIRGGISGVAATGRKVTTKAVKSVTGDLAINRGLWTLAAEMAKLA